MQGGPIEPGAAAERNQRGGGEGEHCEGEGDEEGEAEEDEGGEGGEAEKEGGEEGSAKEQRGECCWLVELASRPPLKAGIWSTLSLELVPRRQGDCEGLPQVKSLPSDQPSVGFELESGLDFEGREGLGEAQVLEEGFF